MQLGGGFDQLHVGHGGTTGTCRKETLLAQAMVGQQWIFEFKYLMPVILGSCVSSGLASESLSLLIILDGDHSGFYMKKYDLKKKKKKWRNSAIFWC
ncbi:hypothetical protein I12448_00400 [Campylobacter jejuni]|nr:hypothetical protein I12448_00400 [Campylobacter jejuni]